MKKKYLFVMLMIFISTSFILLAEEPPIESYGIWSYSDAKSYNEQDAWVNIPIFGKLHYWLYDTYTNHNGEVNEIIDKYIPKWIESMGYVIDFGGMRRSSPNNNLAYSVKSVMMQRGCDVSITIYSFLGIKWLTINCYNKKNYYYWTIQFPLIKMDK